MVDSSPKVKEGSRPTCPSLIRRAHLPTQALALWMSLTSHRSRHSIALADGDADADGESDRPRTRKEIMEEVMMKAKKYKMERQATALETSNQIEELDDEFDDSFKMLLGQASIRAEEKAKGTPRKKQDG